MTTVAGICGVCAVPSLACRSRAALRRFDYYTLFARPAATQTKSTPAQKSTSRKRQATISFAKATPRHQLGERARDNDTDNVTESDAVPVTKLIGRKRRGPAKFSQGRLNFSLRRDSKVDEKPVKVQSRLRILRKTISSHHGLDRKERRTLCMATGRLRAMLSDEM